MTSSLLTIENMDEKIPNFKSFGQVPTNADAEALLSPSQVLLAEPLTPRSHLLHAVGGTPPPVLDIDGQELQTTASYYILPVIRGQGGGLTLARTGSKTCPLDVIQANMELDIGLPVKFLPARNDEQKGHASTIHLSTDLNIKFIAKTKCKQSTAWKVGEYEESEKQFFLTTGEVEGKPGVKTVSNWFKIEKTGDDNFYRLVFCPSVCELCKVVCREVGVVVQDKVRRLSLSDKPLLVMFKKADS